MTDWIQWNGGLRPVPPYERVTVIYRNGTTESGLAKELWWHHFGSYHDIVEYRVNHD